MNRNDQFRLIVFDWEGTLFNSTRGDLFEGVLPMLHALKARGHQLAVATGQSRLGLNEVLGRQQVRALFDSSRTADETQSKPDPQMLFELMDELGVDAPHTLMIGDTTHDLAMARYANCDSVAVSYGTHDALTFAKWAPLWVAHSVQQLHDWLTHGGLRD